MCHSIFICNVENCWSILKILSLLDSSGNLQQGTCYISHHTYNVSLHYLVKNNSKNSKIVTYLDVDVVE